MKRFAVVAHQSDNVATAVTDLKQGDSVVIDVDGCEVSVVLRSDVPFGHKFALVDIPEGQEVRKYGEAIGRATKPIEKGDYVHVHNFESVRGRGDWEVKAQ